MSIEINWNALNSIENLVWIVKLVNRVYEMIKHIKINVWMLDVRLNVRMENGWMMDEILLKREKMAEWVCQQPGRVW